MASARRSTALLASAARKCASHSSRGKGHLGLVRAAPQCRRASLHRGANTVADGLPFWVSSECEGRRPASPCAARAVCNAAPRCCRSWRAANFREGGKRGVDFLVKARGLRRDQGLLRFSGHAEQALQGLPSAAPRPRARRDAPSCGRARFVSRAPCRPPARNHSSPATVTIVSRAWPSGLSRSSAARPMTASNARALQQGRAPVVEDGEMGRDRDSSGKRCNSALAEAVDGVDLQPAAAPRVPARTAAAPCADPLPRGRAP